MLRRTALVLALLCGTAQAGSVVRVTVVGEVDFNQIQAPPLGNVGAGETAILSFNVDPAVFQNSPNFPTRGYPIEPGSFILRFDASAVGLQSPFPLGETPYFVLRDNDPAVDGFFVATNLDFAIGVPLAQTGVFGQFVNNYSVTYGGDTLSSLDILGAFGQYDFTGLSVFGWAVEDGGFQPLGIVFSQMTIGFPGGGSSPGRVPEDITVERLPGGDLQIRWSPSRCDGSADYGIYEGLIGNWYSHRSVSCSDTLGDRVETISPDPRDTYYLVVPSDPDAEGSFGLDSTDLERPQGASACRAQQTFDCLSP